MGGGKKGKISILLFFFLPFAPLVGLRVGWGTFGSSWHAPVTKDPRPTARGVKKKRECIALQLLCPTVYMYCLPQLEKVRTDGLEGVGRQLTNKQSDLSLLPAPPVSTQKAKAKRSRRTGTVQLLFIGKSLLLYSVPRSQSAFVV